MVGRFRGVFALIQNRKTAEAFALHLKAAGAAINNGGWVNVAMPAVNHHVHSVAVLAVNYFRIGKIFQNIVAGVVQAGGNKRVAKGAHYFAANGIIRYADAHCFFVLLQQPGYVAVGFQNKGVRAWQRFFHYPENVIGYGARVFR